MVAALSAVYASAMAADMPLKAPAALPSFDWTGFYVGGHFGYAAGTSNWTETPVGMPGASVSGSLNLFQPFDAFTGTGSYFAGLQAGYNRMLPNRVVLGVEGDVSFPSFPNLSGISIGGASTFATPTLGLETYSETVVHSGTLRGRIGYAPGPWLFYATAGFAWTYDSLTLTQLANGTMESTFHWRLGWAAGAGVEAPVAPHWTMKVEYLFTDYGTSGVTFPAAGQQFVSDFALHQLRVGLNYRFGDDAKSASGKAAPDDDRLSLHGQATFVEQAYPRIRSPYQGPNSLPTSGEGRETFDVTLYAGLRLWQGAELWFNPELDQGFGLGDTHGVAGFTSGEGFKQGSDYPYARIQRAFLRQTIDLGGKSEKYDADTNVFAGTRTADR
ncbi:MAG: outer membrane beta-barrel protein, partial [Hyphomicrobiales bacterium]|nr:outer membrane beta-barrel protein [Hyphomicrobiales bacterium]